MNREHQEDLHAELGYRQTGQREVRQREWFSLRGNEDEPAPTPKAFAKLVNRLRARKWAKENPARATARSQRHQRKPGVRQRINANQNKRRFKAWAMRAGAGIICAGCGVAFCEARPRKGVARRFCEPNCRWRHGARKHSARKHERELEREGTR